MYALASGEELLAAPEDSPVLTPLQSVNIGVLIFQSDDDQIRYWHPLAPNRVSEFAVGDWAFLFSDGDVTIARNGSETLFWVHQLGRGVRTDLEADRAWLASGAVFFSRKHTVYMLPLLFSADDAPVTSPPDRVPPVVPFVSARVVYTLRSGKEEFETWPVKGEGERHVLPPLMRIDGQLVYMC